MDDFDNLEIGKWYDIEAHDCCTTFIGFTSQLERKDDFTTWWSNGVALECTWNLQAEEVEAPVAP